MEFLKQTLPEFGGVLLFAVGSLIFILGGLGMSWVLRPKRPNEEKLTTYESGEDPTGNAWGKFNVRYYIIAIIFILFEVELIFLLPWAIVFGNKEYIEATHGLWGWFALFEVVVFISILGLGLAYAWRKGFLDWVKPEPYISDFKGPVPHKLYDALKNE